VRTNDTKQQRWSRENVEVIIRDAAAARAAGVSQRQFCESSIGAEAARATLRDWEARQRRLETVSSRGLAVFVASVDGIAFLNRLVTALHLVVGVSLGAGVGFISQVVELAGLGPFMANSVRWHQDRAQTVERAARSFGREERTRMCATMKPKSITLCEDETFFPHGQICLVAIEPVSNFIVTETFVADREAKTWNATVKADLTGIPVTVVQSTADEGTSLAAHARSLTANHSPDVFHVQHEVCGGVALALSQKVRDASKAAGVAAGAAEAVREERNAYEATSHGPGRPPNWDQRIADADAAKLAADLAHEAAHDRREAFRAANRGVGAAYHPFDLKTGASLTADAVVKRVEARLTEIEKVVDEAGLGHRATAAIAKARRVVPGMKKTISFVIARTRSSVANLGLVGPAGESVNQYLVPAAYFERIAKRAPNAPERDRLLALAEARRDAAVAAAPELATLSEEARDAVNSTAAECANLFQRSSSCVEGRNGQLSFRHHSLHAISPERLEAFTVMHNFFVKREDGSTAAERFTGVAQRDLFEHVVARMPALARPRVRAGAVTMH
jgi:Family of unknown function (DUF6399)